MKKLVVIFILFAISQSFAQKQSVDSIIKSTVNDFSLKSIKDFFILETYCNGEIKILKVGEIDCDIEDSNLYVFWKENNENFLQRIGNCNKPKIKIQENILTYFKVNFDKIKTEEVKDYSTRKDSITPNKIFSFKRYVSHSCFSKFYFYEDSVLVKKTFDYFDLTSEKKFKNIHYRFNNSLKLVELNKRCEKVIKKYNL